MVGKPGRSGGRRPGAGRPPQTFRLKLGDTVTVVPAPDSPGERGHVSAISRHSLVVQLADRTVEIRR